MRNYYPFLIILLCLNALLCTTSFCLELRSDVFKDGEEIPIKYTGLGEDLSPPLYWSGVPIDTQSFVLIMDDPDAPMGTWVHWVIYNIPSPLRNLQEGITTVNNLDIGAQQGLNSFKNVGYGGPNPPPGPPHRYIFTLYALDSTIQPKGRVTRDDVIQAIEGHILDKAQLVGKFGR